MARAKRAVHVLFISRDGGVPDLRALLDGVARLAPGPHLFGLSLLTGQEYLISRSELEVLLSLPSGEWRELAPEDEEVAHRLALQGLCLSDDPDGQLARLRERDELLAASGWNLYGAIHHFMTRWSGVSLEAGFDGEFPVITDQAITELVDHRGKPPGAFHSVARPLAIRELPLVRREGGLYDALAARRTTRGFDRSSSISLEQLSSCLYYVFGCHGTAPVFEDVFCIKRTSPSGGGLHPVEVYPLVSRVEGLDAGFYHYNGRDHSLELVDALEPGEATALATEFLCGQAYFGSANVSFVMTARFPRSHWKYRRHQKAYPSLLMDAAHLSQTLYLVAAEQGLGAFVTLAVNSVEIEERLGLDGVTEGVLAMAGFGERRPGVSPFEPRFASYVPRETSV